MSAPHADEIDQILLQRPPPPAALLRWDNLEGPPQWLGGVKPRYAHRVGSHLCDLAPGASVTLKVPPRSMVRVVHPYGKLTPDDIELWVSDGSGLYHRQVSAVSARGKSLIAVPDAAHTSLARIARPAECGCALPVAIYVSRLADVGTIDWYCCPLRGCGTAVKLREDKRESADQYALLTPGQPASLSVTGPVRLALETRLRYEVSESRRYQSYQLSVGAGGRVVKRLEYETSSEYRHRVRAEGAERVVGRREIAYLNVPPGDHELQLDATAALYLRIGALQVQSFRFPSLHRPDWLDRGGWSLQSGQPWVSIWDITPRDIQQYVQPGLDFFDAREPIAWRSARDNGHREGGLRGMMLMRAASLQRADAPQVRGVADKIRGFHTFYRNLLPVWKEGSSAQRAAWFFTRRMRDVDEARQDIVLAEQHIQDALDKLSQGFFVSVSGSPETANRYRLPADLGTSVLRAVVLRRSLRQPTRIMVQYDDRLPVELEAIPCSQLPPSEIMPSQAEAGLSALAWQHCDFDAGTLGGPFSRDRTPAALESVATTELLLPAGVRRLKVWATSPHEANLRIALQYRASRTYRLSESAYLQMVARAGDIPHPAAGAMRRETPLAASSYAHRELLNQWLPLEQLLRAHERRFSASIESRAAAEEAPPLPPGVNPADLQRRARELTVQRRWLPALEAWSELVPLVWGADLQEALFARVVTLQHLSESFLAERELRGLFSDSQQREIRREALQRLRETCIRNGDQQTLEQLLAVAALRDPTAERLAELAQSLRENGRFEYALIVALGLPHDQQPLSVMVSCAFQLRWWDVFQHAVSRLPNAEQQAFWTAQRHLTLGQYEQAHQFLLAAGSVGQATADHLRLGQQIHARLRDPSLKTRASAVFDWETWLARHPGPWTWHEDGSLVTSYAGAESVYSAERNLHAQYYTAQTDRPVKLEVLGPVRLQLEVRPLLSREDEKPDDDWLHVRAPGRRYLFPLQGRPPTGSLELVGDPRRAPGSAVVAEVELGPGLHELEAGGEKHDLLVRAFVRRPETPLPILPPLNRDTLEAVLCGQYGAVEISDPFSLYQVPFMPFRRIGRIPVIPDQNVRILPQDCLERPATCPLQPQAPHFESCLNTRRAELGEVLAARLGLRRKESLDVYHDLLIEWARNAHNAPAEERLLTLARIGQLSRFRQEFDNDAAGLPPVTRQATCQAEQDWSAALAIPCDLDEAAILQKMALLVYLAETDATQSRKWTVLGNEHVRHQQQVSRLAPLHRRLTRRGSWQVVRDIDLSAGLHTKAIQDWRPETPSLRVRAAMLDGFAPGDSILTGYNRFLLALHNPRATTIELTVSRAALGHLPTTGMAVLWQRDDDPPGRVELGRGSSPHSLRIGVPQGAHRISLWIEDPQLNQYALVRMREVGQANQGYVRTEPTRLVRETERFYHVATHDEPVRFHIRGESWLRIDELRGETTTTRYRAVHGGKETVELKPRAGEEAALYRIFEFVVDPLRRVPPPPAVAGEPVRLPPPLLDGPAAESIPTGLPMTEPWLTPTAEAWGNLLTPLALMPPDALPAEVHLDEAYRLGGQEDGTWALGVGPYQRRALDEGSQTAAPDRFVQWNATHYRFDPWRGRYRATELLLRTRERAGSTFALRHAVWLMPRRRPLRIRWNTSVYLQRPGDAIPPAREQTEWSVDTSLRLSRRYELPWCAHHTPALVAFGRWLSRDRYVYPPGTIDQDIFTRYKTDHPTGLRLSDTFSYYPWLDTRWWLRPGLVTNENFEVTRPDHVSLRLGWSQLAGPLILDASYRAAHYSNDKDRLRSSNQHLIYFDALAEHFNAAGRRFELAAAVGHDLSGGDTAAYLTFTTFFDKGRAYRDLYPRDVQFLSLRKERAAERLSEAFWEQN